MADHQITLAANGGSAPVRLSGTWSLRLRADTWGASPVAIQFADPDFPDDWTAITDPATGEPIARTADGPSIILEDAVTLVRIHTAAISGTTGLTLLCRPVPAQA